MLKKRERVEKKRVGKDDEKRELSEKKKCRAKKERG